MIVTLDTNAIINACKENSWDHLDVLSSIRTQNHTITLDREGKVLAEYRSNCSGIELFEKWYQEIWQRVQQLSGRLEKRHVTRLSTLSCHEPSDHALSPLRIALVDIWSLRTAIVGKDTWTEPWRRPESPPIREKLGLTVHDAKEARNHLSGAGP